jgi:hypothetical protein
MQQMIFIADLTACSTCFVHHYARHQELESIIQVFAACGIWCFGFEVVGMRVHHTDPRSAECQENPGP